MYPAGIAHDGLASALPEPTTAEVGGAWPASQAMSAGLYGYAQSIASTSTAAGSAPETEQAKIGRILDALHMPAVPERRAASGTASQLSAQTMQTLVFLGANARIKGQSCSDFIESVEAAGVGMRQAPGKAADSALLYHRMVQHPEYQAHMQQKHAAAEDRCIGLPIGLPAGHHAPQVDLPPRQPAQVTHAGLQQPVAAGFAADTWGAHPLGKVTQSAALQQQQQQLAAGQAGASNMLAPIALDDIWGADPNPCTPILALSPIGGLAQLHPADMNSLLAMFMDSPGHVAATAAAALPPPAVTSSMHQVLVPPGWAQAAACSPRGSHMRSTAGPSTPRSLLGGVSHVKMQVQGPSSAGHSAAYGHILAADNAKPAQQQQQQLVESTQLGSGHDAAELPAALFPDASFQAAQRQGPMSGSKASQPLQQLRSLQQQRAFVNQQLHSKQQQQQQQGQVPSAHAQPGSHGQAAQPHVMSPRMYDSSSGGGQSIISDTVAKRSVLRQSDASSNSSAVTFAPPVRPLHAEPASCAEYPATVAMTGPASWLGGTHSKRPGEECAQQQRPAKVPSFDNTSTAGSAAQATGTGATGANTLDSYVWEQPNALVQRAIAAADQRQQQQQQQMMTDSEEQRAVVSHRVEVVGPAEQEGDTAVDMAQLPAAFREHRGPILFL